MTEWLLLIVVAVSGNNSGLLGGEDNPTQAIQIRGFSSEATCVAAGARMTQKMKEDIAQGWTTKTSWSCVEVMKIKKK